MIFRIHIIGLLMACYTVIPISAGAGDNADVRVARMDESIPRIRHTLEVNRANGGARSVELSRMLGAALCTRAFLTDEPNDIEESITIYENILADATQVNNDYVPLVLGACRAYVCRAKVFPEDQDVYLQKASQLFELLLATDSLGVEVKKVVQDFFNKFEQALLDENLSPVIDDISWMIKLKSII